MQYKEGVAEFGKDLQVTLKDIRSHFGVTGGSLSVGGKITVVKEDLIVPSGTYALDVPQTNQGIKYLFFHSTHLH